MKPTRPVARGTRRARRPARLAGTSRYPVGARRFGRWGWVRALFELLWRRG